MPKRPPKRFNPVARDGPNLAALLAGQHMIRGFSNPEIRQILKDSPHLNGIADPKRMSAKTTRILNRCHAHGSLLRFPTRAVGALPNNGRFAMSAAVQLRDVQFPIFHSMAAA